MGCSTCHALNVTASIVPELVLGNKVVAGTTWDGIDALCVGKDETSSKETWVYNGKIVSVNKESVRTGADWSLKGNLAWLVSISNSL